MKSWQEYLTELKGLHDKDELATYLRSKRGMNSDNPDQDSNNTEEVDTLEYEKKEADHKAEELAKKTDKSNKKVKSLKHKVKKLKKKVEKKDDEIEELQDQLDQAEAETEEKPAEETETAPEEPEAEEKGEETGEEEKPAEGTENGEEKDDKDEDEEEGPDENGTVPAKDSAGYDPLLDTPMKLGKNECVELKGRMLAEAVDEVEVQEISKWGRSCYAFSLRGKDRGIVLIKGEPAMLHVLGTGFSKEELDGIMEYIAKKAPEDVKRISTEGGITPGGLNVLNRLARFGWTLENMIDDEEKHYWSAKLDPEKLKAWMKKGNNRKFIGVKNGVEKIEDPVEDTYLIVPEFARR